MGGASAVTIGYGASVRSVVEGGANVRGHYLERRKRKECGGVSICGHNRGRSQCRKRADASSAKGRN